MDGVPLILRALHQGERSLATEFSAVAERHRADHEVHHVATDLSQWSSEHCRRIGEAGGHYGLVVDAPSDGQQAAAVFTAVQAGDVGGAGTPPEPGLLLLADLRALHVAAAGNHVCWDMLDQTAHATRDDRLLALVSFCQPRTKRQMRWGRNDDQERVGPDPDEPVTQRARPGRMPVPLPGSRRVTAGAGAREAA